jgi:hypothetical protein
MIFNKKLSENIILKINDMNFNKKLSENITLVSGDLCDWEYGDNGMKKPIAFHLVFMAFKSQDHFYFYDAEFPNEKIQNDDSSYSSLHGFADLFNDISEKLNTGLFLKDIKDACEKILADENKLNQNL